MKPSANAIVLKCAAVWNSLRGAWMAYFVFLDLRSLARVGDKGPYVGIGVDSSLLVTIGAMPLKFLGILAGFRFGLTGETTVEITATLAYCLVAIGLWRRLRVIKPLALLLWSFEALLLASYVSYAFFTSFVPWSELRSVAIFSWLLFLGLYGMSTVYLMQKNTASLFGQNLKPAIEG